VFVGCDAAKRMFTRIYSSESRRWSEVDSAKSLSLPIHGNGDLQFDQPVLAGNALYFLFRRPDGIKYDLVTEKLSEIDLPDAISWRVVLTNTEDGVGIALVEGRSRLCLWSWEAAGSDKGAGRWTQTKVIELKTILPTVNWHMVYAYVLGSAHDLGLIFVWTTIFGY
jgi:hypothetical protein